MCGIFGIMAPNSSEEWRRRVLKDLAINTQRRGEDATGFAWIGPNGHTQIIKQDVPAKEFLKTDVFKEFIATPPYTVIGHCRKLTLGAAENPMNNHPLFSKVTGLALVHNGKISNHGLWRATNEDGENPYIYQPHEAEVDSESLLRLIETMWYIPREKGGEVLPEKVASTPKEEWTKGVDLVKAIDDAIFNLEGPKACALLNPEEPNVLYLWRTVDRPLEIYYIPEYQAILFASESRIGDNSLKEVDYDLILDYFYEEQSYVPDFYRRSVETKKLLRIEWIGEKEKPFNIDEHTLYPGEASNVVNFKQTGRKFEGGRILV